MSTTPPAVLETSPTNPKTTSSSRSNSNPSPPTPDSLFIAAEQGLLYSELLAEELELRKPHSKHPPPSPLSSNNKNIKLSWRALGIKLAIVILYTAIIVVITSTVFIATGWRVVDWARAEMGGE